VTIILPEKKAKFSEFREKMDEAGYYGVELLNTKYLLYVLKYNEF